MRQNKENRNFFFIITNFLLYTFKRLRIHLLAGLDITFAERVKAGNFLIVGEDFGSGKLIKHAVAGLLAAGVKGVIVRSVNRKFFRMAVNYGLLIIIAPAIVDKYHSGDTLVIDFEDKRIYLNQEEYDLPYMESEFLEMFRNNGIFLVKD